MSRANSFGDEMGVATNFPLARITNTASGHVFYAQAHDPSTMGVATGARVVSTHFRVPHNIEAGASTLQVVANGIASAGAPVQVQAAP